MTMEIMDPIPAKYRNNVGNFSGFVIRPNIMPKIPMIKIQGPIAYSFLNLKQVCCDMNDASQNRKSRLSRNQKMK